MPWKMSGGSPTPRPGQLSEERERLKVSLAQMRRASEEATKQKLKEQQERLTEEREKLLLKFLEEKKEQMKIYSGTPVARVRSHPGENRI